MKKRSIYIVVTIFFTQFFFSCVKNGRFEIDTTQNRIEVKIHRFDSALITIDTTNHQFLSKLAGQHPEFLPIYTSEILNLNLQDSAAVRASFIAFLKDSTYSKVNNKTLKTFQDIKDIEIKVSDAFTYIHAYFPEVTLPEVYFFVSGFNRSVLLSDNFIALGTDLYLGADYAPYNNITYKYLMYNMRRESVAIDLVSATLFRMFPMNSNNDRLIDNMIFRGKIMYILSVFMPKETPENLMGYNKEQWEWSEQNEKGIWAAIIDQKNLFSTDIQLIRKYMNESPFTAPISQDSPGRLGTWIGWRIVESYMNNNKNVGLKNLIDESNSQLILEKSAYRP